MLGKIPELKHKRRSWIIVAAWSLIIFLTIPFARAIQSLFDSVFGSGVYLTASAIIGAFFALIVIVYLLRKPKRRILWRTAWLAGILGVSAWIMRNQLQTPAEALHFFQYGILSYLLFQAWSHHVRDWIIYPLAAVSVVLVATLDETIQWMIPGRYWDYRDIRLNMLAGVIVQAFIARVIKPSAIASRVMPSSIRCLVYVVLVMLLMLGLTVSNTPARVDLYATRIPFLHFLSNNESVMSEFGFRHNDPDIGVFNSRFGLDELLRIDAERGTEAGDVVRRYHDFADYREFLQTFTSSVDPFLHEMRVHLHRRNHYYASAWQYRQTDPGRFTYHMTVAFRENMILDKYFFHTLAASEATMSDEQLQHMRQFADLDYAYASPVSDHLVTGATEGELWLSLLILAAIMIGIGIRYGRDEKPVGAA